VAESHSLPHTPLAKVLFCGMSKMYALAQVSGLESNLSSAATRYDGTL
jgi:hypothetical protein